MTHIRTVARTSRCAHPTPASSPSDDPNRPGERGTCLRRLQRLEMARNDN